MRYFIVFSMVFVAHLGVMGQTSIPEKEKMLILSKKDLFFSHDLSIANYQFDNAALNEALYAAALSHKKRKRNTIIGGVVLGLGAAYTGIGIALGASKQDKPLTKEVSSVFSRLFIGLGVVGMGVSIPFFVTAKNRKKDMVKALGKGKGLN